VTLRTRIAVTFLVLLSAVLAAALGAVSAANRSNAQREVERQLDVGASVFVRLMENNRRQLTQAAQAVAADYGFREAVAARDTDTLASALENAGERIGADRVVLTSLSGAVIAASGAELKAGAPFPISPRLKNGRAGDSANSMMVDSGRVYQLVTVAVRSPLPVAWISMGFELDDKAVHELASIMGIALTLSANTGRNDWRSVVSTIPPDRHDEEVISRNIDMSRIDGERVMATLSISLSDARAPFRRLEKTLWLIAGASLVAFADAAFWLARNITRPLRRLTRAVDQVRAGRYEMLPPMNRNDELGILAEGLNLMQTAVQSRDESISRLAYHDALTGIRNRTGFAAALRASLDEVSDLPLAVVVINLHGFRRINEHLGYPVGDAVLIKTAERLAMVPTVSTSVARVAGDQFAAFTRLEIGMSLAAWGSRLLTALAEPVYVESQPIDVAANLGLALADENLADADASPDGLMRCAELALEQARRHKRPFVVYEAALKPVSRDQLSLLGELRHALEHDEFRLHYQPKMEMISGRVAGVEVLLRWQHPTRGLLSPVDFIPFAEQTGFIRRMTRWTLDNAIAQGAAWQRAGKALSVAVNISAADIADVRLDARVAALLNRHQLPPALLTLEITESGFIEDPARALQLLDDVARLGVLLSIDDFGTGYSSLSHLARMPVHEVKIDRSFIQGLESDVEFGTIVRSAIDMGHGLGLKVVAEGIESESAATLLREFGCDVAQGYLYARPMPCDALEKWLEGRQRVPTIALPVAFAVDDVADTVNLTIY
jgi:diguanylate cyclase (GGDEF)-like protein